MPKLKLSHVSSKELLPVLEEELIFMYTLIVLYMYGAFVTSDAMIIDQTKLCQTDFTIDVPHALLSFHPQIICLFGTRQVDKASLFSILKIQSSFHD